MPLRNPSSRSGRMRASSRAVASEQTRTPGEERWAQWPSTPSTSTPARTFPGPTPVRSITSSATARARPWGIGLPPGPPAVLADRACSAHQREPSSCSARTARWRAGSSASTSSSGQSSRRSASEASVARRVIGSGGRTRTPSSLAPSWATIASHQRTQRAAASACSDGASRSLRSGTSPASGGGMPAAAATGSRQASRT